MAQTALGVFNGSLGLFSQRQMQAALGKHFSVTNPTPGTAIVHALQTAFSATANGLFLIQNNNAVGGANLLVDSLAMIQTATAPTGTLAQRFEAYLENTIVTPTGAAAVRTPVNALGASGPTTKMVVYSFAAGAMTIPANAGTRTLVDVGSLQTDAAIVHDQYGIDFGSDGALGGTAGLTAARAVAARLVTRMAPFVIPPGYSGWINQWWKTAAVNTPAYEFTLKIIES